MLNTSILALKTNTPDEISSDTEAKLEPIQAIDMCLNVVIDRRSGVPFTYVFFASNPANRR